MTEPIVYFGIGFFVAALLGLLMGLQDRSRAARIGSVDQFQADVRQLEEQLAVALGENRYKFSIMGPANSRMIAQAVARALGEDR